MKFIFMLKKYVVKHIMHNFASVFHGIRFKVKRLFVATTSNFFYVKILRNTATAVCLENTSKSIIFAKFVRL